MQISQGTFFYEDLWKEVVTPTYLDYYFFNVTNKEEFLKQSPPGSVKLRVEEVGPYRYRLQFALFQNSLDLIPVALRGIIVRECRDLKVAKLEFFSIKLRPFFTTIISICKCNKVFLFQNFKSILKEYLVQKKSVS